MSVEGILNVMTSAMMAFLVLWAVNERGSILKGGIEGDIGITQFRIGKKLSNHLSIYGTVNPTTLFAANIAGVCSKIFNVGFLGGIGIRYRLSKRCSLTTELSMIQSYCIVSIGSWQYMHATYEMKLFVGRLLF